MWCNLEKRCEATNPSYVLSWRCSSLPSCLPLENTIWNQGTLVSVDMMTIPVTPRKVTHRYQCVVSDGTYLYTLEYEEPLKAAVHDPVKFMIEKDRFVLLDADGKKRSTRIEKRERVLLDP